MKLVQISQWELTQACAPLTSAQERATVKHLRDYLSLTDAQLRGDRARDEGRYLAESLKIIEVALSLGHRPRSILSGEKWAHALNDLEARYPALLKDCVGLIASVEQLKALTGYHVHRGALASIHRPAEHSVAELVQRGGALVVLEDLVDHSNIGAICRSVVGLGASGVLLTPRCADPLYRRSIRVSMGAALKTSWARAQSWDELVSALKGGGYELFALGVGAHQAPLNTASLQRPKRVALLLGSEGPGLSAQALESADHVLQIPMFNGVESLNVASAAAVAMWALLSAGPSLSAP